MKYIEELMYAFLLNIHLIKVDDMLSTKNIYKYIHRKTQALVPHLPLWH